MTKEQSLKQKILNLRIIIYNLLQKFMLSK